MNKQLVLNCVLCFLVGFFLHSILKHGFCGKHVVEGVDYYKCTSYQEDEANCKNGGRCVYNQNDATNTDPKKPKTIPVCDCTGTGYQDPHCETQNKTCDDYHNSDLLECKGNTKYVERSGDKVDKNLFQELCCE